MEAKSIYKDKSKDTHKRRELLRFETYSFREEEVNLVRNLRIVDALYKEAVTLGIIPLKNPLDGIEVDLKIAKEIS